jgi:hypothetical protein
MPRAQTPVVCAYERTPILPPLRSLGLAIGPSVLQKIEPWRKRLSMTAGNSAIGFPSASAFGHVTERTADRLASTNSNFNRRDASVPSFIACV